MLIYQLLRPFGYLAIHHSSKKIVDWYIPAALTAFLMALFVFFKGQINVWGDSGLVALIQNVVQGLPGFYIAALAAVATFGTQSVLDVVIPEPTPTIETWYGDGKLEIPLTRRRFLTLLFAYLTAISLCISIASSFFRVMVSPVESVVSEEYMSLLSYAASTIYFFFVAQMLIVTLWGLYYLSDRIHQPDSGPVSERGMGDDEG